MKIDTVIKHFGSQLALAQALGIGQPTVSMWRARGSIPQLQQMRIEALTRGKIKAQPLLLPSKRAARSRG